MIPLWIEQAVHQYGYLLVFIAIGVESTGIPFPGETTLIAAAVYAGTGGPLNPIGVIAAAAAGAIIGDNLGYLAGYYGGYPLIQRILRLLHLSDTHWQTAQRYFDRHGAKTVFFGRFVTVLRTWAAFLAGASRMPWQRFLFWNACGGILWAAVFGSLGYVLGHNLPLLAQVLHALGLGGTLLVVLVVAGLGGVWLVRRRARLMREAALTGTPAPASRTPARGWRVALFAGAMVALLAALLAAQVAGIGGA